MGRDFSTTRSDCREGLMTANDPPVPAVRRARRGASRRGRSTVGLLAAWYSPTSSLRAAFHRFRGVHVGQSVEIGYFVILDNLYPERSSSRIERPYLRGRRYLLTTKRWRIPETAQR